VVNGSQTDQCRSFSACTVLRNLGTAKARMLAASAPTDCLQQRPGACGMLHSLLQAQLAYQCHFMIIQSGPEAPNLKISLYYQGRSCHILQNMITVWTASLSDNSQSGWVPAGTAEWRGCTTHCRVQPR
jgi:hypothetical protein